MSDKCKLTRQNCRKKDDDTAGKSSLLRSWDDKDPLKRPSCALLVILNGWSTVTTNRPILGCHDYIHAGVPLAYVSEREGGGRRALDASNAAHSMLMALGTHHSHGMVPTLEGRGDDEAEPECEEVYQKPSTSAAPLMDISLDHRSDLSVNGVAVVLPTLHATFDRDDTMNARLYTVAGQARFHRLLHKLKVTEVERHAELLLAVAAASPAMAADYLSSCALNMEPKASSSRWLVGMTVVGQLVQAAAKAADPFQQLINRSQQPPQLSSPLVQAFICQMSPPCLPRAVLSKGIQHPDALVRHTTLCTLLKVLQTLTGGFQKLQAATHKLSRLYSDDPADHAPGAQHSVMFPQLLSTQLSESAQLTSDNATQTDTLQSAGNVAFVSLLQQQLQDAPFLVHACQQQQPSLHAQWTAFTLHLQQAFRARFPDPQSLLATLSTLQRDSIPAAPSGSGADSAAETAPDSAQPELDSDLQAQALPESHSAESADLHKQELHSEVGMTAQELTTTVVFMVLKAYQSCLPEAMSDSRIDVVGLMPQGVLDLPVLQQHALLELQLVRFPSSSLSPSVNPLVAFNTHYSAASFLPVLKLLTGSASHGFRQLAGQLLTRRIIDLLGGAFEDEVALWLGLLPNCPHAEVADATWTMCVDGVLGFLAEALASLGRRPQFYWGLMQSLLPSRDPAAESGSPPSDPPFSLLVISAVQQALKVACFSKLPSESRTWVSAYTAAVTAQLLSVQIDPQPLCCLVIGLFQQAAEVTSSAQEAAGEVQPDAAKAANLASKHAEHAVVLSLPAEAQPLASLLGFAQGLLSRWQYHGTTLGPNLSKLLQADRRVSDTPQASRQGGKKKRKGEEVASGQVHSRKKQKSGPEAEESVEMQEYGAARRLDLLLSQCEHQASSQARGQANQQLQLLTALYQCPVSVVQQKMPFVLKLGSVTAKTLLLSWQAFPFCSFFRVSAMMKQSGLDLADALINLVIGSHKSGGLSRLDHLYTDLNLQGSHGSQGGAAGGQEGVQDAWARIIGGLLAVALRQHGDKAIVLRDKVAVSTHTSEATALLLPTALAYLDQLASSVQHAKQAVSKPQRAQHGGTAVTAGVKAEIGNMAKIAADNVRTFYEKELMMYLTARFKNSQGVEQLSSDAVSNLHKHAVEVLKRCWEVVPADLSRTQKALNRLLPATGWPLPLLPLDGSSNGTPGSSDPTWLPLPGQQAQVAAMLLQQAVQQGSMEAQDLARFTQSCLATLSVAYKQAKLSTEAQGLVDQLSAYVDGFVGDCLAELPDQDRGLSPFSSLAAPVRAFAAAVLKFKLDSPATIKLLRRLLAALLPDGNTDVMEAASDDDSPLPTSLVTNPEVSAMASHIFDRLTGLTVKGELAELLDTLIDLQQSYPPSDPSSTLATPFHHKLHSLLPLLLSAYGATLSSPDQSLLCVLLHINSVVYHSPEHQQALQHPDQAAAAAAAAEAVSEKDAAVTACINGHADQPNGDAVGDAGHASGDADDGSMAEGQGGVAHGPISALLHGPLATAGFTRGEAAKAAHEHGLLLKQSSAPNPSSARCALTAIHFPEQRTLTADEPAAEPLPATMQHLAATAEALLAGAGHHRRQTSAAAVQACDTSASSGGQHQSAADPTAAVRDPSSHQAQSSSHMTEGFSRPDVTAKEHVEPAAVRHHAAGYDPVWMLLWAVKALQDNRIGTEEFISQGVLSLCLRSLAAQDSGLRALAYEALGLFLAALTAGSNQQTRQVQLLLESLKRSISQPFQQLPGVIAAFAAEAVFVLMSPGCAVYPPLNKLLLKRSELNIQEVPLMYQLLVSGNQQHSEEQVWIVQLLAAGLRGPLDAQLYRRRFVVELLMNLHDSPLANGHIRRLALHTLTAVAFIPAYAKDLMCRAGLQMWLDARVNQR
ncbi:MAG: hypothetical protein FRX49_03533 [Trebouxia sp. A1-2]|nr:MAG: hypothetical protein FRX49_03533 [Trebouxia sp. A1-2]